MILLSKQKTYITTAVRATRKRILKICLRICDVRFTRQYRPACYDDKNKNEDLEYWQQLETGIIRQHADLKTRVCTHVHHVYADTRGESVEKGHEKYHYKKYSTY